MQQKRFEPNEPTTRDIDEDFDENPPKPVEESHQSEEDDLPISTQSKEKKRRRRKKEPSCSNTKTVSTPTIQDDEEFKCITCHNTFPTRNKMFQHLKKTGHAKPMK